jgi:hypothetical protein
MTDDDDPSDLEKKSTGNKRKWGDDYNDHSRDDNDRFNLEKKSTKKR